MSRPSAAVAADDARYAAARGRGQAPPLQPATSTGYHLAEQMTDSEKHKRWWRREPMRASGIVRLRTGFLPIPSAQPPRRKLARPPMRWSLVLLLFAIVIGAAGALHRRWIDQRLARLLVAGESAPFEVQRIRRDLVDLELDEQDLTRELDARLKYAQSQKARDFYIVIDTKARRFDFKYGNRVVRSAPVEVGAARTIEAGRGKSWTFVPITGAFSVKQKLADADWKAPEWAYALSGKKPPDSLPEIPNGLGRYVLVFADGYVIHSKPSAESPLAGPKPGSFLVPEADLAAVWKRVGAETRVYIF
jgi:L,D-transpeptidase-like protein